MNAFDTTDYTRQHDLTVEEVKACPIFAHVTDQEARDIIETIKRFTKISYDFYKKEQKNFGKTDENS